MAKNKSYKNVFALIGITLLPIFIILAVIGFMKD